MPLGLKAYMPRQDFTITDIGEVSIKLCLDEHQEYFYLTRLLFGALAAGTFNVEMQLLQNDWDFSSFDTKVKKNFRLD